MRRSAPLLLLLVGSPLVTTLSAQASGSKTGGGKPVGLSLIREAEIKRDLYAMAGDDMRGREAGTIDEMRASMWVAEEMRKSGVKPKGEDGSWFQWWNMRRTRISSISSSVKLGSRTMSLWTEITPTSNAAVDVSAQTVFVGDGRDTTIDVRGKIAVATLLPPTTALRSTTNTYEYRYTRQAVTTQGAQLSRRGAAGVILVADSIGDIAYEGMWKLQSRGTYDVVGGVPRFSQNPGGGRGAGAGGGAAPTPVPVLFVKRSALNELRTNGQTVDIKLRSESFETPSVNIIGVVQGTDPKLRDEYVVFSSHQDHDGVRFDVAGDSIWNGADDNATTSVALLAIARSWVKHPSKRSALFIFHGAEERGLLGSRYHVAHPVVPLKQMVAVLNGDMLGRNHPDTAALMGSQPPHRNSTALVQMALDANRMVSKFVVDSSWDRPTHPEGWYFRSDHVPYAERSVPSLFFSSNLHPDYHTPRDEPKTIDYPKLTRITQWMYMTGWMAGNTATRPAIDPGFVLR